MVVCGNSNGEKKKQLTQTAQNKKKLVSLRRRGINYQLMNEAE